MAKRIPGVPRSTSRHWPPKLRAQVERAVALGCTISRGAGGHYLIHGPAGRRLVGVLAESASDWRAGMNHAADLRRALDKLEAR